MRRINVNYDDEMEEIKKGPWKVEEDEVLRNHVEKCGPRDWSSIRSKGLLKRTGKSCRLRWVNKLRPDLKNGVKFSAEEERIVLDLQAKFGNKWARIATHLKGRTDNDVKNFWSSRQKRLARFLRNSAAPSSSKSNKFTKQVQATSFHDMSSVEVPTTEEESFTKSQSCSSSQIDDSQNINMVPLPELVYPSLLSYEQMPLQQSYNPPLKIEPQTHLSFPEIPQLQSDFPLSFDDQYFGTRLGDSNFMDVLGGTLQLPIMPSFFVQDRSCEIPRVGEGQGMVTSQSFIDDFPPIDMFDHIEPLPSPSEWS